MGAAWAGKFNDWETSSGRIEWERERDKELMSKTFFNKHEMATIAVVADIIIPKDSKSGSATDAGGLDLFDLVENDMPNYRNIDNDECWDRMYETHTHIIRYD